MILLQSLVLITIQLLLLVIGSSKVATLLFQDYTIPKPSKSPVYLTHLLFSISLSCSCTLFLLVFAEITKVFSRDVLDYFWKVNLNILLLLVIIVIPWCQLYTFLHLTRGWRIKSSIFFSTILWTIYLYLFSQINQDTSIYVSEHSWLELGLFRTGILGITVISILSGFGVVNAPFTTWSSHKRRVSEKDYNVAEHAYQKTFGMVKEKKDLLNRMKSNDALNNDRGNDVNKKNKGFFGKMISSMTNNSESKEQVLLQTEIEQLEGLLANMKSDLDELERGRAKSRFSQTWKGKIWNIVDMVFSIYCTYKFIVTLINVLLQRNTTDPITNMLSMMISHFDKNNVKIDTEFWSQQLSFWFAGIIVFGSVRGFLKLLTRVLHMFLLKITFSTSNRMLFVAHMMGMYFLSSVLMMQLSLPTEYRYLLHSTEFDFFKRWSDIIFVGSSLISLCIIYVIYQTHDAKSMASDFADVELLNLESGRSLVE